MLIINGKVQISFVIVSATLTLSEIDGFLFQQKGRVAISALDLQQNKLNTTTSIVDYDKALTLSFSSCADSKSNDLFDREGPNLDMIRIRSSQGFWPFDKTIEHDVAPHCLMRDSAGKSYNGINFASQDYLGLAQSAVVKDAAIRAIYEHGLHSAGSSNLMGNTQSSNMLEKRLARFVGKEHAVLFPAGWMAGYGVIRGLVSSDDHIVMDRLCHNCLQEGSRASTSNIYPHSHLDVNSVERHLRRIRRNDKENGILVVTEGIFSMDADAPDLLRLQAVCHAYNARLLVDCAHDLGNMGPGGTGQPGVQGVHGKIDIVMGAFSKTFASTGGFVACNSPQVIDRIKYLSNTCMFSNSISPILCGIVLKSLDIIESEEGDIRRGQLMQNVLALRNKMIDRGYKVMGEPHAVVPIEVGSQSLSRIVYKRLLESGVIVNLVEYPAVPIQRPRFRIQVMATHTLRDIDETVERFDVAFKEAQEEMAKKSKSLKP